MKLSPVAKTPTYGSTEAAGADLYVCRDSQTTIGPGETVLLPTGIAVEIPTGYVGLIFARSSLGTKRGLAPANKVGVIDSDYRGEIKVALHNHSGEAQVLLPFERVAQLVIVPCLHVDYQEVPSLEETQRGAGGFGSTGRT
jgi:dUTP pyrophosphatase